MANILKNKKILISDKDPRAVRRLRSYLSGRGYKVRSASRTSKIIEILQKNSIDVFVVDVDLKNRDGSPLFKIAKIIRPELPLIVTSSDDKLELEELVRVTGVFYYCLKPFGNREIGQAIKRAINFKF